jgi:hypothetical protein
MNKSDVYQFDPEGAVPYQRKSFRMNDANGRKRRFRAYRNIDMRGVFRYGSVLTCCTMFDIRPV